jgi:hypothetical protein
MAGRVVAVVDDDDGLPELLHAARHSPAASTDATRRAQARFAIRRTP